MPGSGSRALHAAEEHQKVMLVASAAYRASENIESEIRVIRRRPYASDIAPCHNDMTANRAGMPS
jgi:hypothetical protein